MSKWLRRLKGQDTPDLHATKTTELASAVAPKGSEGFVACPSTPNDKLEHSFRRFRSQPAGALKNFSVATTQPADTPAPVRAAGPDAASWPHSDAMNGQEIEMFRARQDLFFQRGRSVDEAERMADKLVARDRDLDGRRYCLECRNLRSTGTYRCGNPQAAGVHADLARDLVLALHRCCGYADARLPLGLVAEVPQEAKEKDERIDHG